ncbi:XrtA/PEP-CTERM system histidine kinase PrsK [Belnapia moabensis]|uniref:XrtA/PEP-CTERM system histidine kinase PrsK n=1 Tax=Belnapia moabensis TaxID=365533 RepID=UPI0006948F68|nr:XrtA/PEP-CTERM system histidine kinase PrsK [Belnapia moabensis]
MSSVSVLLHAGSAAVCLAWTMLVLATANGHTARLLAAASGIACLWAAAVAADPAAPLTGLSGVLEIARWLVWLGVLLFHFHGIAGARSRALSGVFSLAAALLAAVSLLAEPDQTPSYGLGQAGLLARLGLALLVVLISENLFRTADEAERWHVGLPAIALGVLSAFDVMLYASAVLSREFFGPLLDARAALVAIVTPLLALAAVRNGRWRRDPPVSRQVVFHGATLVVGGGFLIGVGALGETLRHLDWEWGITAQASLIGAALTALAVAASSRSARSRLRHLVVDHFFTARYDYRCEWLRCVDALSAADGSTPAEHRAIRAIADAVDSPAGVLLKRDPGEAGLRWAGSWNSPAEHLALPAEDPFLDVLGEGAEVLVLDTPAVSVAARPLLQAYGRLWLAAPLVHGGDGLAGVVLLAPPRAAFRLDREVSELLRTLGCEVAMFLAERRAAERLADERRVADYAKRFAFVAHDVKTVSSQLSLLLANAEANIADPEFQRDMLVTVRASAARINALLARLGQPGDVPAVEHGEDVVPLERLRMIAAAKPYPVHVEGEGGGPHAAIAASRFDTAVGHLMNNAAEASPPGEPVRVRVSREGAQVIVEVIDRGPGMTSEFIRDELFRPLATSKRGGSGIGAWQARELLREAGGDLAVISRPGAGTIMRLLLPARECQAGPSIAEPVRGAA